MRPILATWLLFAFATLLSFLTDYAEAGLPGFYANFYNIADTIVTFGIFLVVVSNKNTRKEFTVFEKCCLGAVSIIFVFWAVSRQNIAAHLAIQLILVIAYLPTLLHLWQSKKNTESLSMWIFDCLASFFGTIEPLRLVAPLPLIYGIRSVISTFAVVVLVIRVRCREHTAESNY